jgi:hypothetical protein
MYFNQILQNSIRTLSPLYIYYMLLFLCHGDVVLWGLRTWILLQIYVTNISIHVRLSMTQERGRNM